MRHFLYLLLTLCLTAKLYPQSNPQVQSQDEKISIEFNDWCARKVIMEVARLYGIVVTLPDGLNDITPIKLRDVTWRQIFRLILAPRGYDFVQRGNSVEVLTIQEIDKLPPDRRRVEIYFQRPDEMSDYLRKIYSGNITVERNENSVIFIVNPRFTQPVLTTIEKADSPDVRLNRYPRKPHFPEHIPDLPQAEKADGEGAIENPVTVSTEVILLNWVDCAAVREIIENEYPMNLRLLLDHRSNSLIVTATPPTRRKVTALARYLDDKRWYVTPDNDSDPALAPVSATHVLPPHNP